MFRRCSRDTTIVHKPGRKGEGEKAGVLLTVQRQIVLGTLAFPATSLVVAAAFGYLSRRVAECPLEGDVPRAAPMPHLGRRCLMKPLFQELKGSLLAAMVAAAQLAWISPALAQDYPPDVRLPGREAPAEGAEELPAPLGDRPVPGTPPLVVDVILQGTRNEEKAL